MSRRGNRLKNGTPEGFGHSGVQTGIAIRSIIDSALVQAHSKRTINMNSHMRKRRHIR
jgi:hypothetical protein